MEAERRGIFPGYILQVCAIPDHWLVLQLHLAARKKMNLDKTDTIFLMAGNTLPSINATVKEVHAVS